MNSCPQSDTTRGAWRSPLTSLGTLVLALAAFPPPVDAEESSRSRTAVAREAMEWDEQGKPAKLEFDFGDFTAWARHDGSWKAAGEVQHRGLLCATYTLSLRVGRGEPGCSNVQWYHEPHPVDSVHLCNNATGRLGSGDITFADVGHFHEITCAERTISCSGNCK